jgi:hypothetical protein
MSKPLQAGGEVGIFDFSSAPHCVANRTDPQRIAVIAKLRQLQMTGPRSPRRSRCHSRPFLGS